MLIINWVTNLLSKLSKFRIFTTTLKAIAFVNLLFTFYLIYSMRFLIWYTNDLLLLLPTVLSLVNFFPIIYSTLSTPYHYKKTKILKKVCVPLNFTTCRPFFIIFNICDPNHNFLLHLQEHWVWWPNYFFSFKINEFL